MSAMFPQGLPKCERCHGSGVLTTGWLWWKETRPCDACDGTGERMPLSASSLPPPPPSKCGTPIPPCHYPDGGFIITTPEGNRLVTLADHEAAIMHAAKWHCRQPPPRHPVPAPLPTSEIVELHNAFMWDCNACGPENFARGVTVEFTPEDAAEQAKLIGEPAAAEGMVGGDWMQAPETVTCTHCGHTFQTEEH